MLALLVRLASQQFQMLKFQDILEIKIVIKKSRCFFKILKCRQLLQSVSQSVLLEKDPPAHCGFQENEDATRVNSQPYKSSKSRINWKLTANLAAL